MKKDEIVERARYALTHSRARYRLGAGGYDPGDRLPDRRTGSLDCSGFVAWCLGMSRKTYDPFLESVNGGWIETTGIVKDALDPEGIFTLRETAEPGDLYVWGDRKGGQGHVGVISAVDEDGKPTKVIHASLGNDRAFGKAIAETGPEIFERNHAILVEYDPSTPPPVVEPEPIPEPEPEPVEAGGETQMTNVERLGAEGVI